MNSFAQTYLFGNTALDPERERKVAIYGRVSTQHEAQIDALGNQSPCGSASPSWTCAASWAISLITPLRPACFCPRSSGVSASIWT